MTPEQILLNVSARLHALEAVTHAVAGLVLDKIHPTMRNETLVLCSRNIMARADLNEATRREAVEQVGALLGLPRP